MSIWKYMFDSDHQQRRDIEQMRADLAATRLDSNDSDAALRSVEERLSKLQQNVDMQGLVLEAVIRLLQRQGLDRNELDYLMQCIDLEDGVQDGAVGVDRSASAPRCMACGRPINPKRQHCLYCRAPLRKGSPAQSAQGAATAESRPQGRMVNCAGCGARISETDAFFGDEGQVCERCFRA